MATVSLIELIMTARFTMTNPGRSAQNDVLRLRSNPGHEFEGMPTQGASPAPLKSYRPNGIATEQPARMPMTGDHCCKAGEANSLRLRQCPKSLPTMGAPASGAPSGTSDSLPSTTEMIVDDSNMSTVPATTGVMIRRNSESREISTN